MAGSIASSIASLLRETRFRDLKRSGGPDQERVRWAIRGILHEVPAIRGSHKQFTKVVSHEVTVEPRLATRSDASGGL